MANVKGVSPDAEIVTNAHGGMQSMTAYSFHLCDTNALLALAETLQIGASRYERDNWRKIPCEEHFNHMLIHYYAWLKGDRTDDHLAHMFTRAMMVYATANHAQSNNAVPVVHGKWILDDSDEYANHYHCSICEKQVDTCNESFTEPGPNYCPFCGTKMDADDVKEDA